MSEPQRICPVCHDAMPEAKYDTHMMAHEGWTTFSPNGSYGPDDLKKAAQE
jgi:hypothetical protein